jgi:hypothetical protein
VVYRIENPKVKVL